MRSPQLGGSWGRVDGGSHRSRHCPPGCDDEAIFLTQAATVCSGLPTVPSPSVSDPVGDTTSTDEPRTNANPTTVTARSILMK